MGDSHSSWFRGEESQAAVPTGDGMGRLRKRPSRMTQELADGYLSLTAPQPNLLYQGLGAYSYCALFRQCSGHGALDLIVLQAWDSQSQKILGILG